MHDDGDGRNSGSKSVQNQFFLRFYFRLTTTVDFEHETE